LAHSVAGLAWRRWEFWMALYHRDVKSGSGQVIDVTLYETVLNLMVRNDSGVRQSRRENVNGKGCGLTGIVAERDISFARMANTLLSPRMERVYFAIYDGDWAENLATVCCGCRATKEGRNTLIEIDQAITNWTEGTRVAEALTV